MSKLVNWGHWVVAAFFAGVGVPFLWSVLAGIPTSLRQHPREVTYIFFWGVIMSLPPFVCAWGIWTWKKWGHVLGLVQMIFALGWCIRWLVDVGVQNVGMRGTIRIELLRIFLICVCILGWLVLPAVRHKYWPKVAAA
jgi:hypothetical protein